MIYTSHGLMTQADLEEYRQATDWYELHPHGPDDEADQCVHGRLLTDNCDDCEAESIGEAKAALNEAAG